MQWILVIFGFITTCLGVVPAQGGCPEPCEIDVAITLNPALDCLRIHDESRQNACVCFIDLAVENQCDESLSIPDLHYDFCRLPDESPNPVCEPIPQGAFARYVIGVSRDDGDGLFSRKFLVTNGMHHHQLRVDYEVKFSNAIGGCYASRIPLEAAFGLCFVFLFRSRSRRQKVLSRVRRRQSCCQ